VIYFDFFSMRLSQSHDSSRDFSELNRVVVLCPFLINFLILTPSFNIRFMEIELHDIFQFNFYKIISVSWHGLWVWWVDSNFFPFLNWLCFSIPTFNIKLIGNQTLWFILICFMWGYLCLMIQVMGFAS
jgi:hypothetical protein